MSGGLEGKERLRADLEALRMERDAPAPARRRVKRKRWPWVLGVALALAAALGYRLTRPVPVRTARAEVSAEAASLATPVLSGAGYLVPGEKVVAVGAGGAADARPSGASGKFSLTQAGERVLLWSRDGAWLRQGSGAWSGVANWPEGVRHASIDPKRNCAYTTDKPIQRD